MEPLSNGKGCIPLIADQHDYHVRTGMLTSIIQPRSKMVERVTSRNIYNSLEY